jgi:DNA modification methylase
MKSEVARLIAEVNEMSNDTLENAIIRGLKLHELKTAHNIKWNQWSTTGLKLKRETAERLILVATCHLKDDPSWDKPWRWTVYYEVIIPKFRKYFLRATGNEPFTGHDGITRTQNFVFRDLDRKNCRLMKTFFLNLPEPQSKPPAIIKRVTPLIKGLTHCHHCHWRTLANMLPDGCVSLLTFCPPYGIAQRPRYIGIAEEQYPTEFLDLLTTYKSKLTPGGSVVFPIRALHRDGQPTRWVQRAIDSILDAGWYRPEELIWVKTTAMPAGSIERPRREFEHVLWFTQSLKPDINLKASGKTSKRIGLESGNDHGNFNGVSTAEEGTPRITDVFFCNPALVDTGIDHPAPSPPDLFRQFIRLFPPPGSLICDPFTGSGTTLLVGQSEGHNVIGCDIDEAFAALTNRRLASEPVYFRGEALRQRERDEKALRNMVRL